MENELEKILPIIIKKDGKTLPEKRLAFFLQSMPHKREVFVACHELLKKVEQRKDYTLIEKNGLQEVLSNAFLKYLKLGTYNKNDEQIIQQRLKYYKQTDKDWLIKLLNGKKIKLTMILHDALNSYKNGYPEHLENWFLKQKNIYETQAKRLSKFLVQSFKDGFFIDGTLPLFNSIFNKYKGSV